MNANDACAFCRHERVFHRRNGGGKLFVCRKYVKVGAYDIRLCGCRAFREQPTEPRAVSA